MTEKLTSMKNKIEKMSKEHQIEILRLFHKMENLTLNENNNGTFINLLKLTDKQIDEVDAYMNYVAEQSEKLTIVENKKQELQQSFFTNNELET